MRLPLPALLVLAFVARAAAVTVTDSPATVQLATPELTVTVQKAPFALTAADAAGTLLQQATDAGGGSLVYTRGGTTYRIGATTGFTAAGARVTFGCITSEGTPAAVAVEFVDDGTFLVELAPSDPATVTRAGETLVAFAGERFYGLTERIVSEGPLGLTSEVSPQAVGSLDRRGEIVSMSVAPTISIYAPFHHSSRGYGLFVDGPMMGTYDLAKTDPTRVSLSFDFDAGARVFRYYVFHGPGHATILVEWR